MEKQLANIESKRSEEIIGVGKEKPISNKDILDIREELKKDILKIKQEAENLKQEFDKLEKRQDRANSFMMWAAGVVVVSFVLASIPIFLDYFKNNQERYEKFIDKTEETKQNFYTKEQVDNNITFSATQIKNDLDNFKKCLKDKNYWEYDQCYK